MEAGATAGGLDILTGRYVPNVVIVPPARLGEIPVADYGAAGLEVVLEPNITSVLYADRNAIIGFFRKLNMEQRGTIYAWCGSRLQGVGQGGGGFHWGWFCGPNPLTIVAVLERHSVVDRTRAATQSSCSSTTSMYASSTPTPAR